MITTQSILVAYPKTVEQISALEAFMHDLKITFEVSEKGSYNPEFVEKVLESRWQARNGRVARVEKEGLKELLGL